MTGRFVAPYVEAGYTVWVVTRRRGMPDGHSVADMADDVAEVVGTRLGGRVDVVLGESFGGMLAQQLAARHPDRLARLVVVAAAVEVSAWGKEVDSRLAPAVASGDRAAAGAAFAEYALPWRRAGLARRLAGPIAARWIFEADYPPGDVLVETEAELAFDSRAVLPQLRTPTRCSSGATATGSSPSRSSARPSRCCTTAPR
jgi:pimeloyl-ACP methyl ester carboxylesterase